MSPHLVHPLPDKAMKILEAASAAARQVPPAFPLDATVAVNPFLGHAGDDLATASARLQRLAGTALIRERSDFAAKIKSGEISPDDLAAALAECSHRQKPADVTHLMAALDQAPAKAGVLPTVADLAARASCTDWPMLIRKSLGLWAAGHFDRGQALWSPTPGKSTYAAWREWATHDLSAEIAGLRGFCTHVAAAPDTPERMILRAVETLGLDAEALPLFFHRLLLDVGGWAQHARYVMWQAEMRGETDHTVTDLLAIRLVWEEALFRHVPALHEGWSEAADSYALPVVPSADDVIDAILQEAAERSQQRQTTALLVPRQKPDNRPLLQAAFCIDVRSEILRRALEAQSPGIETIGFAGFFGLPVAHRPHGSVERRQHLPVLLNAKFNAVPTSDPLAEEQTRITARAHRAWHRFRQAAVSSFAFVESAGPFYGLKLVRDALGLSPVAHKAEAMPRFEPPLSPADKLANAKAILKAMGMGSVFARLVLLVGHGAAMTNNPHHSAYHCGACGGETGEVSARLLAALLNDPETRNGLAADGMHIPEDTLFVAGLHDTTTDRVTLFEDAAPAAHGFDLDQAKEWLQRAGDLARQERAQRLPRARAKSIAGRAANWAEVRPEWGLAGCSAFIAAPRAITVGSNLKGRAFLHSYDWQADPDFGTLELILTAPVVVASWISLQYYGSSVAPAVYGGGNKLIHNVVGGIGVIEGNGGVLRPGLSWQAVHDGEKLIHDPLRLTVFIEAPVGAISRILSRHDQVRELFDKGWLHLVALQRGQVAARYRPGLRWDRADDVQEAA